MPDWVREQLFTRAGLRKELMSAAFGVAFFGALRYLLGLPLGFVLCLTVAGSLVLLSSWVTRDRPKPPPVPRSVEPEDRGQWVMLHPLVVGGELVVTLRHTKHPRLVIGAYECEVHAPNGVKALAVNVRRTGENREDDEKHVEDIEAGGARLWLAYPRQFTGGRPLKPGRYTITWYMRNQGMVTGAGFALSERYPVASATLELDSSLWVAKVKESPVPGPKS